MPGEIFLDRIPLWLLYAGTVALLAAVAEIGYRIGVYRSRWSQAEAKQVGPIMAAVLGLLAFLVAIAFGMAEARFQQRKQLVLEEANVIGTTYRRTSYLPEKQRAEARKLLRNYVAARLEAVRNISEPEEFNDAVAKSEKIHDALWSLAVQAGTNDPRSVTAGLMIESVNDLIDTHSKRMTAGLWSRIPSSIWIMLYVVAAMSIAIMGYHGGLNKMRSSIGSTSLILTFTAVLILIADLDRPRQSLFHVSQQVMFDLQNKLGAQ